MTLQFPDGGFQSIDELVMFLANIRPQGELDIAARRAYMDSAADVFGAAVSTTVEPCVIGGITGERHIPPDQAKRRALYVHGGGFTVGSARAIRHLASRIACDAHCEVIAIDYALAPEHRFPRALEDTMTALRLLGADSPVAIIGDSAGGNLALNAALLEPGLVSSVVLLSPWLDLRCDQPSFTANAKYDRLLDGPSLRVQAALYADGVALSNPLVSPLLADLSNLPPCLLQIGTAELFLDEARDFAARAKASGRAVELSEWNDMIHGWHLFWPVFVPGAEALDACAAFIAQVDRIGS